MNSEAVIDDGVVSGSQLVTYDLTEAQIAAVRERFSGLSAVTPQGYEEVRIAIAHLRDKRVAVEGRRVELKAEALAFGRLVDSEAKRLIGLLAEIEQPLKAKKATADEEKARAKAEVEALKLRALEADLRAKREKEEAELRAAREVEQARMADERAALDAERLRLAEDRRIADESAKAEREASEERLRAERAELERQRRDVEQAQAAERERARVAMEAEQAALKAEREALDAERRAAAAERERLDRIEFERQGRIRAEQEAAERSKRERVEASERAARIAAVFPDVEKLDAFAADIRALVAPHVSSESARCALVVAMAGLASIASQLVGLDRKVA